MEVDEVSSHVPVLKHLLGSTTITKRREELIIFIQPHIIMGEDDLIDANVDHTRRTIVAKDAAPFSFPPRPVEPSAQKPEGGSTYFELDGTEIRRPTIQEMPKGAKIRPLQ